MPAMQRPGQGRLLSLPPSPGGRAVPGAGLQLPACPAGSRERGPGTGAWNGNGERGAERPRTAMAMAWRAAPRAAALLGLRMGLRMGRRGIASCIDRKSGPGGGMGTGTAGPGHGTAVPARRDVPSCQCHCSSCHCSLCPSALCHCSPCPAPGQGRGHTAAGAPQWGSARQWGRARKEGPSLSLSLLYLCDTAQQWDRAQKEGPSLSLYLFYHFENAQQWDRTPKEMFFSLSLPPCTSFTFVTVLSNGTELSRKVLPPPCPSFYLVRLCSAMGKSPQRKGSIPLPVPPL